MSSNNYVSNLLTIDEEIFNILRDAKDNGHPFLKYFSLLYPEKAPVQETNVIYIGRLDAVRNGNVTFDGEEWDVRIEILVLTKKYEHLERRKTLKTGVFTVMEILRNSPIRDRVKFERINFEYDQKNIVQQVRLVIKGTETFYEYPKEEMLRICKIIGNVEIEEKIH